MTQQLEGPPAAVDGTLTARWNSLQEVRSMIPVASRAPVIELTVIDSRPLTRRRSVKAARVTQKANITETRTFQSSSRGYHDVQSEPATRHARRT